MKTWKRFYAYKSALATKTGYVSSAETLLFYHFVPSLWSFLLNDWINVGTEEGRGGRKKAVARCLRHQSFPRFSRWRLIILVFNVAVVPLYFTGHYCINSLLVRKRTNTTYTLWNDSKIHVVGLTLLHSFSIPFFLRYFTLETSSSSKLFNV